MLRLALSQVRVRGYEVSKLSPNAFKFGNNFRKMVHAMTYAFPDQLCSIAVIRVAPAKPFVKLMLLVRVVIAHVKVFSPLGCPKSSRQLPFQGCNFSRQNAVEIFFSASACRTAQEVLHLLKCDVDSVVFFTNHVVSVKRMERTTAVYGSQCLRGGFECLAVGLGEPFQCDVFCFQAKCQCCSMTPLLFGIHISHVHYSCCGCGDCKNAAQHRLEIRKVLPPWVAFLSENADEKERNEEYIENKKLRNFGLSIHLDNLADIVGMNQYRYALLKNHHFSLWMKRNYLVELDLVDEALA